MIILFLFTLLVIIYHYVIYTLIIFLLSFIYNSDYKKYFIDNMKVSFIVAALNEEKVILQKIKNCLEIDYPKNNLQFIFVLDGSTDKSYEIVKSYEHLGFVCLHDIQRRGKTAALNRGMEIAEGDVVVFSDANSFFDKNAIKKLLQNFSDESIGGVCGRKAVLTSIDRVASKGDNFYWNIESIIKTLQSKIGSISTGDGEIFAIRRNLYQKISEEIINDDTAITFDIILKGYRVVYEPTAITYEEASLTFKDDYNVKVRMVAGGYQSLKIYIKDLLIKEPLFLIQFISHKFIRWFMPFLLITLLISNLFLLTKNIFLFFFILQSLFYFSAFIGYKFKINFLYFPLYYVLMNSAAFMGLCKFARGDMGIKIWKKAKR